MILAAKLIFVLGIGRLFGLVAFLAALLWVSEVGAIQPPELGTAVDRVTLIERNAFYSDCGDLVFVQDILWQIDPPYPNVVRAWRMTNKTGVPYRTGDGWALVWSEGGRPRRIRLCGLGLSGIPSWPTGRLSAWTTAPA